MTADALAAALSGPHMSSIFRSVEPAWPHEGCGFVFADADGAVEVLPTENRAQALHERFPDRYPRGAEDWFEPDMKPWLRAVRAGGTPLVIYHSHPDVGAYFSESDHAQAVTVDEAGATVERNPGVRHLVVSVRQGRADGARLFEWAADSSSFVEVARFGAQGLRVAADVAI